MGAVPSICRGVLRRLHCAIEAADFWNLHEIDPQALLSHAGYTIGVVRQLLFFHSRYVVRILAADPAALLEAPLKFSVLELPKNSVTVRWADPIASCARYRNVELEELGRELSEACDGIVGAVLRPDSRPPNTLTINARRIQRRHAIGASNAVARLRWINCC